MTSSLTNKLKNLKSLTRVEFVPAYSTSIIIGFAWAINIGYTFTCETVGLLISLFFVLSAVGTLGAHWNTFSDHDLDADDPTKTELNRNLSEFGWKNQGFYLGNSRHWSGICCFS